MDRFQKLKQTYRVRRLTFDSAAWLTSVSAEHRQRQDFVRWVMRMQIANNNRIWILVRNEGLKRKSTAQLIVHPNNNYMFYPAMTKFRKRLSCGFRKPIDLLRLLHFGDVCVFLFIVPFTHTLCIKGYSHEFYSN